MISKSFDIDLDIVYGILKKYSYTLVQGDTKSYIFNINLQNSGTALDLSTADHVKIYFKKADGNDVEYSSLDGDRLTITDAVNGVIQYEVGSQEIARAGTVIGELSIHGTDGEELTTPQFSFITRPEIGSDGSVQSTTEYSTLTTLIIDTQDVIDEANSVISTANQMITDGNNKIIELEEARSSMVVIPKTGVATYTDISTTYPTPTLGWLVHCTDTGKWWRYDGSTWINTATYSNSALDALIAELDTPTYQPLTNSSSIFSTGDGEEGTYSIEQGNVSVVESGMSLRNDVPNGDFADGTTGWTTFGSSTLSATNNILADTGTGGNDTPSVRNNTSVDWSVVDGDKWFIYVRTRVTNVDCSYIRVMFRDNAIQYAYQYTPTQNTWYEIYKVFTANGDYSGGYIDIAHKYPDSSTANGKVMEVDGNAGVFAINMTALGIESYTEAQMLEYVRNGYFEGTQHAGSNRLVSEGKNRFDKSKVIDGYYIDSDGSISTSSSSGVSELIKIKFNAEYIFNTPDGGLERYALYDVNKNKISVSSYSLANSKQFNSGSARYVRLQYQVSSNNLDSIQLEEGTQATEYEQGNKSSILSQFFGVDSNGNPRKIKRLPNGVTDKVAGGELTQNVSDDITLDNTNNWTGFVSGRGVNSDLARMQINGYTIDNNMDESADTSDGILCFDGTHIYKGILQTDDAIGFEFTLTGGNLYLHLPESELSTVNSSGFLDYLLNNPLTLNYQLATPITHQIDQDGSLEVYEDGTIYQENYDKVEYTTDVEEASVTITTLNRAFTSIDKILILNGGQLEEVTGYSFDGTTISGLTGETDYIIYGFVDSATQINVTTVIDYTINKDATLKNNTTAIKNINNELAEKEDILNLHNTKITKLEDEVYSEDTRTLTQEYKSIWTTGTGKDENDDEIDVSKSVEEGLVSDLVIKGNTVANLLGNQGNITITRLASSGGNYGSVATGLSIPSGKYLIVYNLQQTASTSVVNSPLVSYAEGGETYHNSNSNFNTTTGRKIWKLDTSALGKTINALKYGTNTPSSDVVVSDFMIIKATDAEFDATGNEQELLNKYHYISDSKSTFPDGARIVSTTQNRIDLSKIKIGRTHSTTGIWELNSPTSDVTTLSVDNNTVNIVTVGGNKGFVTDYMRIEGGQTYYAKATVEVVSGSATLAYKRWAYYDINKNYISCVDNAGSSGHSVTVPSNAVYLRLSFMFTNTGESNVSDIYVYKGSVALASVPEYDESIKYINSDEELRSLPNGTKDEVNVSTGEKTKRNEEENLQSSNITSLVTGYTNVDCVEFDIGNLENHFIYDNSVQNKTYIGGWDEVIYSASALDNLDNEWKSYGISSGGKIWFVVPKNQYTDVADARVNFPSQSLIYQLAVEQIIPIDVYGSLIAYRNGTIFLEPYHRKSHLYGTGLVFTTPLSSIDKVVDINGDEVDLADVTLASNGLSATITGATSTDTYTVYGSIRSEESALPSEVTMTYPMNLDSVVFGAVGAIQSQSVRIMTIEDTLHMLIVQNL